MKNEDNSKRKILQRGKEREREREREKSKTKRTTSKTTIPQPPLLIRPEKYQKSFILHFYLFFYANQRWGRKSHEGEGEGEGEGRRGSHPQGHTARQRNHPTPTQSVKKKEM